ncbi:MAG: GntR family transcriptional regulator [Eubacteriales bacterium]
MAWKFDGSTPIYLQIADHLLMDICAGRYQSGDRLPSVRDLAQIAGVNPNTAQRAMTELECRGVLVTQGTQGRTVLSDSEVIAECRRELAGRASAEYLAKMQELGYSLDEISKLFLECKAEADNKSDRTGLER